jgi:hypothetical protein
MNNNQTALLIPEPQQAIQPITPLSMIQLALQQGASVEILRDLFQLKKEVEADEARKAYDMAFAAFKSESIRIVKNIEVTAGPLNGKKYADLLAVVEALDRKALGAWLVVLMEDHEGRSAMARSYLHHSPRARAF